MNGFSFFPSDLADIITVSWSFTRPVDFKGTTLEPVGAIVVSEHIKPALLIYVHSLEYLCIAVSLCRYTCKMLSTDLGTESARVV